ncbi:sulfur oxidation c-type cytochrome SoxX [Thetidibacter halocola]|uniref:Sulfur oxidation c-type cytochrome SoxX n=1 Tax=Thetidibacter halocola TaxID=2827239 RepID=A0A8J7WHR6_9RHOB|nr:sulfur oxidation c-type cytochrome SoxX [Thetidibacter halocola]MBS0125338.1 sulfur oxidation c-type cytochrome SoxX [Thetidibacter halocola]
MRLTAITAAVALTAGVAFAETVAPDNVAFDEYGAVEVSLTGTPGNAENGAKVMTDRGLGNCVACHVVSALSADFQGEVGPSLDGVGGYRSEAELRGVLVNAKKMFDGTVMPAFYKVSGFIRPGDGYTGKAATEITPILSAQEIEDVVAFLMTLKDS